MIFIIVRYYGVYRAEHFPPFADKFVLESLYKKIMQGITKIISLVVLTNSRGIFTKLFFLFLEIIKNNQIKIMRKSSF